MAMVEDRVSRRVARCQEGIGKRIAKIRGARSQRQFARELGVFQQNINRYERGTTPHVDFVIRLAIKERVDPTWLLLGKK